MEYEVEEGGTAGDGRGYQEGGREEDGKGDRDGDGDGVGEGLMGARVG